MIIRRGRSGVRSFKCQLSRLDSRPAVTTCPRSCLSVLVWSLKIVSLDCNDMCRICRSATFIFSMMFPDVDDL